MPETEAEALLRSGALYPRRLGLRSESGGEPLIFAGFKHGAFSLYLGDDPSYHFDLEGRWQRCYVHPSHHLRRLDGSTQAIDRPRHGRNMVLDRRTLDDSEADVLDESIRALAIDLNHRLDSGMLQLVEPSPPAHSIAPGELREFLHRIARWDRDAWRDHRSRYQASYGSIPYLPPDGLESLVLQATLDRGPDQLPEARSPERFAEHCRAVNSLLGRGVVSYRSLYLAGPDVLRWPVEQVEGYFRIASEVFPLVDRPAPARRSELPIDRPHREGFQAFIGCSEHPEPSPEVWPRYHALGLRRLSVGLKIGDVPVPKAEITPREEIPRLVLASKSAGIAVSVLVWIGPGEDEPEPIEETASLIQSLGLGPGDHVYLIDGTEREESGAAASRDQADTDRVRHRVGGMLDRLSPLRRESGVKVRPYSIRKQGLGGA